jgi:DNA-binding MarR family transcriptional regulator
MKNGAMGRNVTAVLAYRMLPSTAKKLHAKLGVSRVAVNVAIKRLIEKNHAYVSGEESVKHGKAPIYDRVNA